MNKGIIFLLGVATGSAATYFIVKKKYEKIANEEIESVVETFKNREKAEKDSEETQELANELCTIENVRDESYQDKINDLGYSSDVDTSEEDDDYTVKVENGPDIVAPYIISEDEYGEFGNEEITLIYYDDNVLCDEEDNVIVNPEDVVGQALTEFDDQYTERVYVRDESHEIDYIILRSEKRYSDIASEEEY
jgi:hypothetical protein